MANTTLNVIMNTKKTGTGEKDLKSGLGGLKKGLGEVVQGLTGFSLASLGAAGAVVGIVKGISAAVNKYTEYADQIRTMSNLTGMQAEETSRLYQLSDDYGISAEKLTTILQGANRNGFEPSIDNLADLSDKYLALESPLERNKLLMETLGRQGMDYAEVMKLGGDAIRERAAAVEDGLILDEEALQKSRDYQMAVDGLGDSFDALVMSIGSGVIPALTGMVEWLTNLFAKSQEIKTAFQQEASQVAENADSYEEYLVQMADASRGVSIFTAMQERMSEDMWNASQAADDLNDGMGQWNLTTLEVAESTEELNGALIGQDGYVRILSGSMDELTKKELFNAAAKNLDGEAALALANEMGLLDDESRAYLTQLELLNQQLVAGEITAEQYAEQVRLMGEMIDAQSGKELDLKVILEGADEFWRLWSVTQTWSSNPLGMKLQPIAQAEGGDWYVTRPTLFLAGEAGPERATFTPLRGGSGQAAPAGAGVVINWQGSVRSEMDIEMIARRLAELMQRRM